MDGNAFSHHNRKVIITQSPAMSGYPTRSMTAAPRNHRARSVKGKNDDDGSRSDEGDERGSLSGLQRAGRSRTEKVKERDGDKKGDRMHCGDLHDDKGEMVLLVIYDILATVAPSFGERFVAGSSRSARHTR